MQRIAQKQKKITFVRVRKLGVSRIVLNCEAGTVSFSELSSVVPLEATGYKTFFEYINYLKSQGYEEEKT
ncbi:hypothetical protein [Listeria booriae]|uniref:Uncharacterized protein n=1 Tax=Listeria booriae TaxID=1552123 RepID=A0A7X0YJP4_9LIST|nr:hypothetical protein [Listeria booriae]MBC2115725.1 hypothetical protein [Listeria booriae]MBC2163466.1 hypothetical protein [Listeria booriae]